MNLQTRVERLEQHTSERPQPEPCITVSAGSDYQIEVPVSLLPTIEKIYGKPFDGGMVMERQAA